MSDITRPRLTFRQRWHRLRTSSRFPFLLFFGLLVAGGFSQVYCYRWDVRLERMLARCNGSAQRIQIYPPWIRKYLGHPFVSHFEPICKAHLCRYTLHDNDARADDLQLLRGAFFLRELTLFGQLDDSDVKRLKCLTQLTTVHCSGNPDPAVDGVKDLPNLTCLHLHYLQSADARLFKKLAAMPKLESLHLSVHDRARNPGIVIAGMRELAKSQTLRRLEAQLSDDEFLALTSLLPDGRPPLPRLLEVRQSNAFGSLLTDRGLANLGNLPSLIHLDVRYSKITDQGLTQLRDLPFLRTLYLENCFGITDEGAEILATMHRLESLNVSQTRISRDGLLHVATLPRLRCLRATYYDQETRSKLLQILPADCELCH
jgi:Leucine Rich repeat